MKTIGLACDHAGFELKEYVRGWLEAKGWAYKDFGTNSTASVDYPDYAHPLDVYKRQVINIGIDVTCDKFVEAVKENHADILCMSALLTLSLIHIYHPPVSWLRRLCTDR